MICAATVPEVHVLKEVLHQVGSQLDPLSGGPGSGGEPHGHVLDAGLLVNHHFVQFMRYLIGGQLAPLKQRI